MNILARLFAKPEPLPHVIIRHVVSTKAEDEAARAKRIAVQLQLAVYKATTTPAQRKADAEAARGKMRACAKRCWRKAWNCTWAIALKCCRRSGRWIT